MFREVIWIASAGLYGQATEKCKAPTMNDMTHNEPADVETASDDYALRFAGSVGTWMLSRQTDIVLELLKLHTGVGILDVGRMVYINDAMAQGAREGARWGAVQGRAATGFK